MNMPSGWGAPIKVEPITLVCFDGLKSGLKTTETAVAVSQTADQPKAHR